MTEREYTSPGTYPGPTAGATGHRPQADSTVPQYSDRPVAFRGPDSLGGLLLILAGVAAAVSLLLPWLDGEDITGLSLVRRGIDDLGGSIDDGLWQPLAIVLGGGVLFLLGLAMWLPLRTHRFLGVLALLVTAAVAAGVLVPLADADWDLEFFDLGFWFGIAVAVLGLLGSLKALFTGPRYGTR
jgi:hypothetical protein